MNLRAFLHGQAAVGHGSDSSDNCATWHSPEKNMDRWEHRRDE